MMKALKHIRVEGARTHNLKNITLEIPRNELTVITGLSGSGKSSLAFDTLFAEGQRRYVESLSAYARQFLGKLDKPDVDKITGISPAIAIEQKVTSKSSRSTVGTSTEIYDYLKLLFARVGKTYSPVSGMEVKCNNPQDILKVIEKNKSDRFLFVVPLDIKNLIPEKILQRGFSKIWDQDQFFDLETDSDHKWKKPFLLIDRLSAAEWTEDDQSRIIDSAQITFKEGNGECVLYNHTQKKWHHFSNRFEADGMTFELPSLNFFSFNNPIGACKKCGGFGSIIGVDENLVVPDKKLSIYQDAIQCWRGEKTSEWKNELIRHAKKYNIPIHKPYKDLSAEEIHLIWNGTSDFDGVQQFSQFLERESFKIQYRVMLSRYRGKTICPECKGTRLRSDAGYVKVGGMNLPTMVLLSIGELKAFFDQIQWSKHDWQIAKRIVQEITSRLDFLLHVGLEYLTLNRLSSSLSGGESQRINLATNLGSSLVGSIYILDEPSIGLHPRDTDRLIKVLFQLKNQGNTVLVVEHDESIMKKADFIVDLGPEAGMNGGHLIYAGEPKGLMKNKTSLTAQYLGQKLRVTREKRSVISKDFIELTGAQENNLQYIDIAIPLHAFTVVTGVSGSGKSTLIRDILYPALAQQLDSPMSGSYKYTALKGAIRKVEQVEWVDQNPIGRSSRSNPVTYLKAYDEIREIFASQPSAIARGFSPTHFSFNVEGGRCETCQGEGVQVVSMQFMADVQLTCETCKGKRFKDEIIDIEYKGKNISEVLAMTVDEAIQFFDHPTSRVHKNLIQKILPLQAVGMGYIGLGQSSSTLSGGEAQRIKLASFLSKRNQRHTVFFFDEPTTGLHLHDVAKLMKSFEALLAEGHTIVTIEHHVNVIECADWMIDLGPEGGDKGGQLMYQGPVKDCQKKGSSSITAQYLDLSFV